VRGSQLRACDALVDRFMAAYEIPPGPDDAGGWGPLVAISQFTARSAIWPIFAPCESVRHEVRPFSMLIVFAIADAFWRSCEMGEDGSGVDFELVMTWLTAPVIGGWASEDAAWEAANLPIQPPWLAGFYGGYSLWKRLPQLPLTRAAVSALSNRVSESLQDPDDRELFGGLPQLALGVYEALIQEV
jgi:hypothetical protein